MDLDFNKSKWRRENKKEVAVKKFQNVTNVSSAFLNEVEFNLEMNDATYGINTIQIYGITRDQQNGEYAIVTEFKNGGNLRQMIKQNHSNLTWKVIIEILMRICEGLCSVHDSKHFHKDLHSGNILHSIHPNNKINYLNEDIGLEIKEIKEIKEAFNWEREVKWKARLAELATNPIPLKKSQNSLTSKRLDYSQSLSQKLSV
ncbi:1295_t:CDS:2 [Rhizophagus irregularis]|nr:1295_t:CDS:2 [Rhizophagus irregularis]